MAKKKEMLVVVSKVKEHIKSMGCMTSGELAEALNEEVHTLLDRAAARTKANGRATVKAQDL